MAANDAAQMHSGEHAQTCQAGASGEITFATAQALVQDMSI